MLRRVQMKHVKDERDLFVDVENNYIVKLYCFFQDDEYLYSL